MLIGCPKASSSDLYEASLGTMSSLEGNVLQQRLDRDLHDISLKGQPKEHACFPVLFVSRSS